VDSAAFTLVTCPWCCSFWIGLVAAAVGWQASGAAWSHGPWWFVIGASAFAYSLLSGLFAAVMSRLDD
jgi:hypothetical protein